QLVLGRGAPGVEHFARIGPRFAGAPEVEVEPRPRGARRHERRRLADDRVELGERLLLLAEIAQHAPEQRARAERLRVVLERLAELALRAQEIVALVGEQAKSVAR